MLGCSLYQSHLSAALDAHHLYTKATKDNKQRDQKNRKDLLGN